MNCKPVKGWTDSRWNHFEAFSDFYIIWVAFSSYNFGIFIKILSREARGVRSSQLEACILLAGCFHTNFHCSLRRVKSFPDNMRSQAQKINLRFNIFNLYNKFIILFRRFYSWECLFIKWKDFPSFCYGKLVESVERAKKIFLAQWK